MAGIPPKQKNEYSVFIASSEYLDLLKKVYMHDMHVVERVDLVRT